jgi:hypothetical protein
MNFEKTTGYITIPDQYVVYTKIKDGNDANGEILMDDEGVVAADNK